MKYSLFIFFLLGLYLIYSCEEEIAWDAEELPEMLVVEGTFSNELKKHKIYLSKSANYFSNVRTPRVSNATVTISDEENKYPLVENPPYSGIYETIDAVAGRPGVTYTLDIHLDEAINNQKHYFSSGTIKKGIDIDSLSAGIYENPMHFEGAGPDSLILVLVVMGKEPSEIENFYQINLYKNNELINDTVDEEYIVRDTEEMEGDYINTFFFLEQFNENDTVQLEIISVEEQYLDFVNGVQNIANQSANPFDMTGPPANAIGNIKGAKAIGFFKVAYVSRISAQARDFE